MLREIVENVSGLNERKLLDYDGEELKTFDYHGNTYKVKKVLKSSVIAVGPDGEEDEFELEDIKDQDDMVDVIEAKTYRIGNETTPNEHFGNTKEESDLLREIVENVSSKPNGLGKAALKAVRDFIKKKTSSGKVIPNHPGYEWAIGGDVKSSDVVVQKMFGELIDLKSRRVEPADKGGYNEYIGYWGKPGTGINTIVSWKYNNKAETKVYFEFTDDEEPTKSERGMI